MYILIPDLYLFYFHQNLNVILMSFFVFIYLFSIFNSTKYLFLLLPFLIVTPAYVYYISIYHAAVNEQILSVIVETDTQEAIQFLGANIYFYFLFFVFWVFYCFKIVYRNYNHPLVWVHWSRYMILILGTIFFLAGYYFNSQIVDDINKTFKNKENNFLVEENNAFIGELKKTYPLGLIISNYNMLKEQKKINQVFEKNNHFKFYANRNENINGKEIYVLVLGETSRRENWQLNGYNRKTNPLLSTQENLVNFTDMISLSSATRSSIPMMLTRKPDKSVYRYEFPEKSIISAFKEVGFKTYWLSTQQKYGAFDTSTSVYAKEADEIHFLNKTGYTEAGVHDDVLVPLFQKIVENNEQKQFIVIHTLGSHYNYSHRYPASFAEFTPTLSALKKYSLQDKRYKQELRNSYDNSILFTDYVLDQFIQALKRQKNVVSFLMYSSDHGEDLFDQNCMQSGHGLETARNFEIAGFSWFSRSFEDKYSSKVYSLEKNNQRKINQTSIFPTLLDAANISIPNYTLERSLLSDFKDYPRLVMASKDYDQAKLIGNCREIR